MYNCNTVTYAWNKMFYKATKLWLHHCNMSFRNSATNSALYTCLTMFYVSNTIENTD